MSDNMSTPAPNDSAGKTMPGELAGGLATTDVGFSFLLPRWVSVAVLWGAGACLDTDHVPLPEGVGELYGRGSSNLALHVHGNESDLETLCRLRPAHDVCKDGLAGVSWGRTLFHLLDDVEAGAVAHDLVSVSCGVRSA